MKIIMQVVEWEKREKYVSEFDPGERIEGAECTDPQPP